MTPNSAAPLLDDAMRAASPTASDALRAAALAAFLDEIGAATRDARYAVAAGILRGKPIAGRPRT